VQLIPHVGKLRRACPARPPFSYDQPVTFDGELTRARHLMFAGDDAAARDLVVSLTPRTDGEQLEVLAQLGEVHLENDPESVVAECISQIHDVLAGSIDDEARQRHTPRLRFLEAARAAAVGDHEGAATATEALAAGPRGDAGTSYLLTRARILCAGALCDDDLHARSQPLWEAVLADIDRSGGNDDATDFLLVTGGLGYGRFCVETGRLPDAEPWLRRAGARAHARGWETATARTALERAAAAWTAGDHEATERLAEEALPVLVRHGRADDVARCRLYLGFIRLAVGELAAADEAWAQPAHRRPGG